MGKRERKRDKVRRARVEKRRGAPHASSVKAKSADGAKQLIGGGRRGGSDGVDSGRQQSLIGKGRKSEGSVNEAQGTGLLYTASQRLLVLGDGDFSFSAGLVKRLPIGSGLLATSFDAHQDVVCKYGKKAQSCLSQLQKAHAVVAHGVDATKLDATLPATDAPLAFDAIIFNFPHTGTQKVHLNRQLLRGFFASAQRFLSPFGTVHVTIKTAPPYSGWDVPAQAAEEGLKLMRKVPFRFQDYPGYQHRTTEKDAVKFDAFEKRCVTFIFAPTNSEGSSSNAPAPRAALQPTPAVASAPTQAEQGSEVATVAVRAGRAPRNKKLRLVMERKARLEASLREDGAREADSASPGRGEDVVEGRKCEVELSASDGVLDCGGRAVVAGNGAPGGGGRAKKKRRKDWRGTSMSRKAGDVEGILRNGGDKVG